jgi:hypothetical protein
MKSPKCPTQVAQIGGVSYSIQNVYQNGILNTFFKEQFQYLEDPQSSPHYAADARCHSTSMAAEMHSGKSTLVAGAG